MTNKILILFVGLLVIIGAILLLSNKATIKKAVTQPTPTATAPKTQFVPTPTKGVEEAIVNVTDTGYVPQTVTIKAGTKVVWINKTKGVVTVYSDLHPTHLLYPALNLGQFGPGQSVQLIFPKAGTYGYHNHLIPSQTGKVVVE